MIDVLLNPLACSTDEARGAVYTRREVVETILDLAGYTPDLPLWQRSVLEPCCGLGDFLIPVIERLFASYLSHGRNASRAWPDLKNSVCAVEIGTVSHATVSAVVTELLESKGVTQSDAERLTSAWIMHADFLLVPLPQSFDFIIGNPPYLRQERIPEALLSEYRQRYTTLYDRADIYVPFIERSLNLLRSNGQLSFICSDRWMKNRYGGPLRQMVSRGFHLKYLLCVNDVSAFTEDVVAYPAIFVIENALGNEPTKIAVPPRTLEELRLCARSMRSGVEPHRLSYRETRNVVSANEPWLTDSNAHLSLIRRLEGVFPTLEEAGCRVGIGVATGADRIYIGPYDALDVEDERKLPLVGTKDIVTGDVIWQGGGVVNPFEDDGSIARLDRYPRFRRFMEKHEEALRRRNVAQRSGAGWYRTIDRIHRSLLTTPKLLIPDIKGAAHVVYEDGRYYPHHNLYYVASSVWDLHALQAVLRSQLCRLFIVAYSTRMRGGFLRFQAQYLRRLRLPKWKDVGLSLRKRLREAAHSGDAEACDHVTAELFRLNDVELGTLCAFSES
jgi:hypothetical protein